MISPNFTPASPVSARFFGFFIAALFLFSGKTDGQNLTFPINILEGLQNGQIAVAHSPLDIGTIENAFDGNFDNLARSANVYPMVVTLNFSYPFSITATSFTNNSESTLWTVEAAQSLADLNAKTGSYQKLVDAAPHSGFATSTKSVAGSGKLLRLTMQKQCCDNFNHLEEWGITATANVPVSSICMKPNQVRLIPNASFQPNFYAADASGNEYPISSGLTFSSSNSPVVAVNSSGLFSASPNLGEANITASWNGLTLQKPVKVVSDFKSTNAEKRVIKVAMVIIDPHIPAAGGQRFSEKFWAGNGGPTALAQQVRDSIFSVSGGTIEIQIVETHQETDLSLNRFGGYQISVDSMHKLFLQPGWPTLHLVAEQTPGGSVFQYNDLLNKYNLCAKSNAKQIDEIWVWAMPFIGMYESNMAGTDAFWINGPVLSGNSCTDLVSVMGFNYERYAGCAMHNYTHRIELTMAKVYNTYYHYSPNDPPYPTGAKDPYQLFQNYDALQGEAGNAHVGNGHYPANGTSDYDYDNLNFVPSKAGNWKRYPLLFDEKKQVNCADWGCEGDCGLNFCSYWLRHLPHFKCKDKYGRLNNWWTYIFDYNEGKAMEAQIDDCNCQMFADVAQPDLATTAWEIIPANQNCYTNPGQAMTFFGGLAINLSAAAAAGPFSAKVYLSTDNSLSANDLLWQSFSYTGLGVNGSPTTTASINITNPVPASAAPGNYFAIVKVDADNQVAETDESNNLFTAQIQVGPGGNCGPVAYCQSKGNFPWEDWISSVKIGAQEKTSGKSQYSDFTSTVFNLPKSTPTTVALTTSYSYFTFDEYWRVWIDFSDDGTFSGGGEEVLSQILTKPANGTASKTLTASINIPSGVPNGSHRMRVAMKRGAFPTPCEAFAFGEVEDYVVNLTEGPPPNQTNLRVNNFSVPPSAPVAQSQNALFDLINEGIPPVLGAFSVGVFLSTDNLWGPNDQLVGSKNYPANSTGNLLNQQIQFSIPAGTATGNYFLILKADYADLIAEGNESDNTLAQTFVLTGGCSMTAVVSNPACSGTSATATVLVTATGGGAQGWIGSYSTPGGVSFVTGAYGVPTTVSVFKDLMATSVPLNFFDPAVGGCTAVGAINCPSGPVPYCPSKGNFPWEDWIARMQFKDVDNSSGKSQYSDFTGKTVNVNAGSPVNILLGAGFSYFTFDEYWKVWIDYDQNGIFDEATETFLSLTVPKPPDGTPFFEANASAFVKGGFTQDFTTRMRVAMKRGSYPTPCETFAFGEVEDYSIHIAPGGGQSKPDLSLLNFLAAGSGAQGAVVPYTFDLKNSGTANAAGNYTIGAYLSTDGLLSANDVQVGTIPTGNTPIGTISNVAGAITIPVSLTVGNYFLILKADIDNTVAEIDELNNITSRPFTVTTGQGGGGADLEITLTADKTTVPIFSNVNYVLTAKNNGNQPIQSAKITVGVCLPSSSLVFSGATGLVYAGQPGQPTFGSFDLVAQEWKFTNLAPGQSAQLVVKLFTMTAAERKVVAFSREQSPADPDSQPGNPIPNCAPTQDDEAVWTINAGQTIDNPDNRSQPDEVAETKDFQLFPNPAGEQVFIDLKKWEGRPANLSMFNQLGVLVFEKKLDKIGLEPEAIDLTETMNGAYFLKIETAGQRPFYGKLIVSRLY